MPRILDDAPPVDDGRKVDLSVRSLETPLPHQAALILSEQPLFVNVTVTTIPWRLV
jgi:hypothetical protein